MAKKTYRYIGGVLTRVDDDEKKEKAVDQYLTHSKNKEIKNYKSKVEDPYKRYDYNAPGDYKVPDSHTINGHVITHDGYSNLLKERPELADRLDRERKEREASGMPTKVYDSFTNTGPNGWEGRKEGDIKVVDGKITRPNGYTNDIYKTSDGRYLADVSNAHKSPVVKNNQTNSLGYTAPTTKPVVAAPVSSLDVMYPEAPTLETAVPEIPNFGDSVDSNPISNYDRGDALTLDQLYNNIKSVGSGGGGYSSAKRVKPEMRSAQSMADLLGISYDKQEIQDAYNDATMKKYAHLDGAYKQAQGDYYRSVSEEARSLQEAMMRGDREAALSGGNRGIQTSDAMTALLMASDKGARGATELAQERVGLIEKREAELAANVKQALQDFNALGLDLGKLSKEELAHMIQGYVGELSHDATIKSASIQAGAATKAAKIGAMAAAYNTDAMERQAIYAADQALRGTKYSTDAQLKSSLESIAANVRMNDAKLSVDKYIQDAINATNKDLANINTASARDLQAMKNANSLDLANLETASAKELQAMKDANAIAIQELYNKSYADRSSSNNSYKSNSGYSKSYSGGKRYSGGSSYNKSYSTSGSGDITMTRKEYMDELQNDPTLLDYAFATGNITKEFYDGVKSDNNAKAAAEYINKALNSVKDIGYNSIGKYFDHSKDKQSTKVNKDYKVEDSIANVLGLNNAATIKALEDLRNKNKKSTDKKKKSVSQSLFLGGKGSRNNPPLFP